MKKGMDELSDIIDWEGEEETVAPKDIVISRKDDDGTDGCGC